MFEDLQVRCNTEYKGHLPDFVVSDKGYIFDVYCGDDVFYYCTKWVPNPDALIQIADSFKLDFTCTYDEPGNCVYGEFSYNEGVFTEVELDVPDFYKYDFDEETETYQFEDKNYSGCTVIKEILLQRKKEDI